MHLQYEVSHRGERSNIQRLEPFQRPVINSDLLGLFQLLAQLAQGQDRQLRQKN